MRSARDQERSGEAAREGKDLLVPNETTKVGRRILQHAAIMNKGSSFRLRVRRSIKKTDLPTEVKKAKDKRTVRPTDEVDLDHEEDSDTDMDSDEDYMQHRACILAGFQDLKDGNLGEEPEIWGWKLFYIAAILVFLLAALLAILDRLEWGSER